MIVALFVKFRPCNLNVEKNVPSRCNKRCFPALIYDLLVSILSEQRSPLDKDQMRNSSVKEEIPSK